MHSPKGLIVTSPTQNAGKTVISAGLAISMLSSGLSAEAVKPLSYGTEDNDIVYFAKITNRNVYYDCTLLDDWHMANTTHWNKLVHICKNFTYPVFLETPGCVSTPLKSDGEYYDCTDLAKTLDWPVLLTINCAYKPYETAAQALLYLKQKDANVLGFMFTCSKNYSIEQIEEISGQLFINTGYPCLGIIPYSPSISVEELNKGNIIKLIQEYVDLHPIQTALDLLLLD
ncbi:MAG: AAA family ATPase [Vampirovibrionia bacterium]